MSPRGAARKAAIIEATIARLVAGGAEGLRVRDVAADVGINNATLHHHFPTKSALVAAVVEHFVAAYATESGIPETGSAEARLAAYVAARRARMRATPEPTFVLTEIMVLARRDPAIRRLMADMHARWQTWLAGICRDAGDDAATAAARAARCRHELLGGGAGVGGGLGALKGIAASSAHTEVTR